MKKLLLITLISFGWFNVSCAFITLKGYPTNFEQKQLISSRDVYVGMTRKQFGKSYGNFVSFWTKDKKYEIAYSDKPELKYFFLFKNKTLTSIHSDENVYKNWKDLKNSITSTGGILSFRGALKRVVADLERGPIKENINTNSQPSEIDITFNIKQKKEQCEVIGFKPETEKFADCVLRLVELDVKQQTQNQIATAQNNGNDALAKQLKRQNNLQSSQALIDLGQQLMNPKRYNSNIYMPQTQRCTMQGFGSFATMRCR